LLPRHRHAQPFFCRDEMAGILRIHAKINLHLLLCAKSGPQFVFLFLGQIRR
jgi:hypothetical protein